MNSLVEILNHCSESALQFAWPMLWQSSVLIAVLFVLDFVLRKKVRAAIRYALWLVVLVKLILPTTMASPTNPRWWIHASNPSVKIEPAPVVVTYGDSVAPPDFQMPKTEIPKPSPPHLSCDAFILISAIIVSLSLFAWLLIRWRRVTQIIHSAKISDDFKSLLDEVRQLSRLRSTIRLKLTEDSMSPAVCGLFRPVILLPQSLAKNLSRGQLRAVLLHEAIHLRRGDVWLNCAQALLQILYWWHPLLWLANAHIRRVREEAVDDAVMLTLRDGAEIYAPTLLEVAKFAFRRPLATLGLVGILESRSALRQRIERLMDFRAPRKAGLTIVSIMGILAFTAVALPMGEAPASKDNLFSFDVNSLEATLTAKVNPEIFIRNLKAQAAKSVLSPTNDYAEILLELLRSEDVDCNPPHEIKFNTKTGEVTTENTMDQLKIFQQVIMELNRPDGQCELPLRDNFRRKSVLIDARIYEMRAADFTKIVSGLDFYRGSQGDDSWWSASPEKFPKFLNYLKSSGLQVMQRPRIQTGSGFPADLYVGNGTNSIDFLCKPYAGDGFDDLKMQGTFIANVVFTNHLNVEASAQNGGGIVVRVENFDGYADSNLMVVINMKTITNTINGVLSNTNFRAALRAINQQTGVETLAEPEVVTTSGRQVNYTKTDVVSPTIHTSPGREAIFKKLNDIHFDQFGPFNGEPLTRLVGNLRDQTVQFDPGKVGINFLLNGNSGGLSPTLDPNSGQPIHAIDSKQIDATSIHVTIDPALEHASLMDALDAIVRNADQPIKYSVMDYGIVFSPKDEKTQQMEMRMFKVDKAAFGIALQNIKPSNLDETNDMQKTSLIARDFFKSVGVDLTTSGRSIAYNDKLSLLFVKATASELDDVERAIVALNRVAPQIHIKARFIEVPKKGFVMPSSFSNVDAAQTIGILSETNFHAILHALENRSDVQTIAEPEVVTLGGRQTQMRETETKEVLLADASNKSSDVPQTEKFQIGPTIDLVPNVLADGYTIDLKAIPSITTFPGDEKTDPPVLRRQEAAVHVKMWDNQTLVIGNLKSIFVDDNGNAVTEPKFLSDAEKKSATAKKELLIFITATIVDPAGNRVHSDDEWSSKLPAVPPQE